MIAEPANRSRSTCPQAFPSQSERFLSACLDYLFLGFRISTELLEETDRNELWIANTSGVKSPRRILLGHREIRTEDGGQDLAGFSGPVFSCDAKKVYFIAALAAVINSVRDLGRFVWRGAFFCTEGKASK